MIILAKNRKTGEIGKVNVGKYRTLFICTRKLTACEKIKNGFSVFQNIETDDIVRGEKKFNELYEVIDGRKI